MLVILVSSQNRIKKTLVVSAILVWLTLGAVAMSFAYDYGSQEAMSSAALPHAHNYGLLRSGAPGDRLPVICISGDVPRSAQPNFQASRFTQFRIVDRLTTTALLEIHARKVSLQILQSVLII